MRNSLLSLFVLSLSLTVGGSIGGGATADHERSEGIGELSRQQLADVPIPPRIPLLADNIGGVRLPLLADNIGGVRLPLLADNIGGVRLPLLADNVPGMKLPPRVDGAAR